MGKADAIIVFKIVETPAFFKDVAVEDVRQFVFLGDQNFVKPFHRKRAVIFNQGRLAVFSARGQFYFDQIAVFKRFVGAEQAGFGAAFNRDDGANMVLPFDDAEDVFARDRGRAGKTGDRFDKAA